MAQLALAAVGAAIGGATLGTGVVALGLTGSWNRRISIQAASTHSGRLTKKIQRQVRYCAKRPPRVGPTTAEIAQTLAR